MIIPIPARKTQPPPRGRLEPDIQGSTYSSVCEPLQLCMLAISREVSLRSNPSKDSTEQPNCWGRI